MLSIPLIETRRVLQFRINLSLLVVAMAAREIENVNEQYWNASYWKT